MFEVLKYYGVRPHSKSHLRSLLSHLNANSALPPTPTSSGGVFRSRGNAAFSLFDTSATKPAEPIMPPDATGSHLITTVNCHGSFRFPPQHTLRTRGVCSRIPHPRQTAATCTFLRSCLRAYYTTSPSFCASRGSNLCVLCGQTICCGDVGRPLLILDYFPMPTLVRADATQHAFTLKFCNRTRHCASFHANCVCHLLRSDK